MTDLVLGPLLRHVGEHDATVWVETDRACTVEVLGHTERTWRSPATTTRWSWSRASGRAPRRVRRAAGRRGGVAAAGLHPAPATDPHARPGRAAAGGLRLLPLRHPRRGRRRRPLRRRRAGRLRQADGAAAGRPAGPTRCCCSATRSTRTRRPRRPSAKIRARRDTSVEPKEQVADFEEYTWLYHESLDRPRRPLAALDHPVLDDLRRPRRARRLEHLGAVAARRCSARLVEERIIGGLSSYWVYQHLGNLSPADLADDELYQQVRAVRGDDCEPTAARVRRRRRQGGRRAQGRPVVLPPRPRRRPAARHRLAVRPDARRRRPVDGVGRRVPLDRGAGRGRLRPPAGRHLAAVAAGPRAARHRVVERGARRRARAGRGWRAGPRSCAGPPTSSTGRRSGSPSTGWPSCSRCVGRGEHAGSGSSRRRRSACSPATSTTPTPRGPTTRRRRCSRRCTS